MCSFDKSFSATFTQFLLSQLRSEHVHAESRTGCAAYLASFVARASFVSAGLVISTASEIVAMVVRPTIILWDGVSSIAR